MFKTVVIVNDDDGFTERHVKARTHVIERLANNKKCQKCRKRQRRFRVTQRDIVVTEHSRRTPREQQKNVFA